MDYCKCRYEKSAIRIALEVVGGVAVWMVLVIGFLVVALS